MTPKTVNLVGEVAILQGATFRFPFYWYGDTEVVKTITALTRGYPSVFAAAGHGLPASAVPALIVNVGSWIDTGLDQERAIYVTKMDDDTFRVAKNSAEEDAYTGTAGRLIYKEPVNLASGWSARMDVRESVDSETVIQSFSTADDTIVLGSDGLIELVLGPTDTDALTFSSGVYDLELEDEDGAVFRVAKGKVSLSPQVTRS